jgi:TolA-binding protein
METHRRIIVVAITGALLAAAPVLFATGGDSFDEPAPALGDALDFLPGKSLGEIFLETDAHPSDKETPDFDDEILKLAERLRTEPAAKLVVVADDLLAKARQHYSRGGEWCNLLHDVRDVLTGSAQDKNAAADYLKWRIENKASFAPSEKKDEAEESESESKKSSTTDVDLEKKAREVSGPLKAHWLYLVGADTFRAGDRIKCVPWFEKVVKEFPTHPRAEIALFMLGRCAFSESRRGIESQDSRTEEEAKERAPARKKATEMFERYRKQYPRGRFEADALGWLGALAFDSQDYLKALEYYIAQAETPGHPETIKSAVFMCEKCLVRVAEKPDATAAFAMIARHPRIAMGFTYLVLSAPEAKNYDGEIDKPADVKKWRRTILPRIAAEVVKQKQIYQSGDWKPRYLAMLAQAASATGNQDQALQLTNLSPADLERSDDLLMVRALAFQRAGKATEAIEAYRQLLSKFPKSPLAAGARLRFALALQDNHQAGSAVIELRRLLAKPEDESKTEAEKEESDESFEYPDSRYTTGETYPNGEEGWNLKESSVYPNLTGADVQQVQQAIDTLLNFAPLTELATALEQPGFRDDNKKELRAIIAQRYLAQENFAEAKKFMAPEEFNRLAAKLETLTRAAAGPPQEKAEEMLKLGDAWAEIRGQLLAAPLDKDVKLLRRAGGTFDLMARRANGRSIQLKNIDAELSERDELRHASRWWLNAARARPGTPLGAKARWKALEAMPKLAAASDYAEQLAREIKGEAVSKEIYDRLRTEAPDSVEAKRLAAYWSFPPAPEASRGDGDEFSRRDAHILGYPIDDFGTFPHPESEPADYAARAAIVKRIGLLPEKATIASPKNMATEVRELDSWFRKNLSDIDDATTMNFLDDLAQFFAEPNITQEMQQVYVGLRYDVLQSNGFDRSDAADDSSRKKDEDIAAEIDAALKDPAMQPVADYLEFSLIGLKSGDRIKVLTEIADEKDEEGRAAYTTRDHAGMEKMARDFLKKYPKSHKREAALFVIARSVQALSRPYLRDIGVQRPGTEGIENIEVVQKSFQREPFDPKRVLGALDDYDRQFPNGRYAADVRNLRGMTLWRMHDWPKALDLTVAQLNDKSKPDLQPEAGLRLANIFAALADAQFRADLMDAIRTRPAAMAQLKVFLAKASTDRGHPLRYLVSFLSDQLKLTSIARL